MNDWTIQHLIPEGAAPQAPDRGGYTLTMRECSGSEDVLARLGSRPVLLISGTLDHYAPVDQVRRGVAGRSNVKLLTPEDFHRDTPASITATADWLAEQAQK